MNSYQPFPIYDLRSGLQLDRQPWLLPKDAFRKLVNAYLYQGVLSKRKGYEEWGRIVHFVNDEALGTTVDLQLTYSGTLAHFPLRPGDLAISTADGGETFTDNGDGTLTGSSGGSGTIDYETGAWSITYGSNPGGGHAITADYNYFPGHGVTGIFNYHYGATSKLLTFDKRRFNVYNDTSDKFEDVHEVDVWTGSDEDFMWTENWKDRLFITNNVDRVKSWDGNNLTDLMMDIDGDEVNEVDTCLLLFVVQGRLVALRTSEDSILCHRRARWCKINDPDNWKEADGGGFVDAPTTDWIIGADFLGNDLIVWFERSVWILKYIGDVEQPFIWRRITETEGSYATYSVIKFTNELLAVSMTGLSACDGRTAYPIAKKIPDLILEMNPEKMDLVYGAVLEEIRQNWWLYPGQGMDQSNKALVLNYVEGSFGNYNISMACIGYYNREADPIVDDIEDIVDTIEYSCDDRTLVAGYPITLGGGHDGRIVQLDTGGEDDGQSIELDIESGRWNPYINQGQKARLGYIDFLVDRDPGIDVNVGFFIDQHTVGYQTKVMNCGGQADKEKVWVRLYSGAVGAFHDIRLYHSAKNQTLRIHAIVPWFKPAGRIV